VKGESISVQAGVDVAIRDERVQRLLVETDVSQIAIALDQGWTRLRIRNPLRNSLTRALSCR